MPADFVTNFRNDGFCVLDSFLSTDEVLELKNECRNVIKSMPEQENRTVFSTTASESKQNKDKYFLDSTDKISYFFEEDAIGKNGELLVDADVSLNKIGHALHNLNPVFRKFTFDERVKEVCFQMGFEEPAVVQSMYIFKNPKLGGEVSPHQDASYLYTEPMKLIGFWIALEDATIENGCLKFIGGSHNSGVHRRYIRNPDKTSDELIIYDKPAPFYQANNFTAVPVPMGSCILIDGQVVHCSDPNKSSKSRQVYTFHIIETKNTKYSEENWIQPKPDKPFLKVYQN